MQKLNLISENLIWNILAKIPQYILEFQLINNYYLLILKYILQ